MEPSQPTPPTQSSLPAQPTPPASAETPSPANTGAVVQTGAVVSSEPITAQKVENLTVNTASVVSKIGLYTRITYYDLWILVFVVTTSLVMLINGSGAGAVLVFMFSVLAVTIPIFVIANNKRKTQLAANPPLIDDIFMKKYLRENLYAAIFATAVSLFYAVWALLSMLFLTNSHVDNKPKLLLDAIIFALGFGSILAFSWSQHARTTK